MIPNISASCVSLVFGTISHQFVVVAKLKKKVQLELEVRLYYPLPLPISHFRIIVHEHPH